jgi:hypothetical protein
MDLNNPIGIKSLEPNQQPFIMNPSRFASSGGPWFSEDFGSPSDNTWTQTSTGVSITGGEAVQAAASGTDRRIASAAKVGSALSDTLWYASFNAEFNTFNSSCTAMVIAVSDSDVNPRNTASGSMLGMGVTGGSNIGFNCAAKNSGTPNQSARINTGINTGMLASFFARESSTTVRSKVSGFSDGTLTVDAGITDLQYVQVSNDADNPAARFAYANTDELRIYDNEAIP